MNWLAYWPFIEICGVVALVAVMIASLRQTDHKKRATARPMKPAQKAAYASLHLLRLLGVGAGGLAFLLIAIMVERSILSTYTETATAPSEVEAPAGLPFKVQEISFESEDGLRMAGWYTPSKNSVTIILLHGYGGNRTGMIWHAEILTKAGYGVLMYDERGSGESEGTYRSYGWEDERDVGGAIAFLATNEQSKNDRVGILGCSIGAQIAIQGAAYHPEIQAVWADGPSNIRAQDIRPSTNPLKMLLKAGNYMLDWIYQLKLHMKGATPLIDIIGGIEPRPIMMVAGGLRQPIIGNESELVEYYLDFAGPHTELWTIPKATHCDGPAVMPAEYSERMIRFFDNSFDIERRQR